MAQPPPIQLAPLGGTIPAIPAKFSSQAAAGEFVDFNELLHAIDSDSGDEPPVYIELGEGQQLTLPKRPRKRQVATFGQWAKCFAVYAATLCAHQPTRGPDMMSYLYVIASAQQEFPFSACLAYDVAFRKKAARFRLTSWGQLDPQLYSRAFTGAHRGKDPTHCTSCLELSHPTHKCPLYPGGPAKKPRTTTAGPRRQVPTTRGAEICLNFNRGKCSRTDCPRAHYCSLHGCSGPHPASRCPLRRTSPRKQ